MIKEHSNKPEQRTRSQNAIPRRVTRQQTQSARDMATRTRSQSQMNTISLGYLNDTSQSLVLFARSSQCHLIEITKPSDPKTNCPKKIEENMQIKRDRVIEVPFEKTQN